MSCDQHVTRRALIVQAVVALVAAPAVVDAQRPVKVSRVGMIASGTPPAAPAGQRPILVGRLGELGWVEGKDLVVEQLAYGDHFDRIPDLARELMRDGVDVFVVEGAADAAQVQRVTGTVPIVTLRAGDLIEAGLAKTLARPGGNVTGVQTLQPQLVAKHVSLLRELLPRLSRAALLLEGASSTSYQTTIIREAEAAAKNVGVGLQIAHFADPDELAKVFATLHAARTQALVVVRSQYLTTHSKTVADLALKYRIPTISEAPSVARAGGLMSYGYDSRETVRAAADLVDKILRGAKAADLPIQQSDTYRLILNLKTAKALGVAIPPAIELRANELIR